MDRVRVVVAQLGTDPADAGAETAARALREAGVEVVFAGDGLTQAQLNRIVTQEDPDVAVVFGPVEDLGIPVVRGTGTSPEQIVSAVRATA